MDEVGAAGDIRTVAVIGAGTMGRQIAALSAANGYPVRIHDAMPAALTRALPAIQDELRGLPNAPQYEHHVYRLQPPADHQAILARIQPVADLAEAVAGVDLVIEAVREDVDTKLEVFAALDRLAPDAILSTNSSSLPSSLLAPAIADPGRLLNTHFFAPIWSRNMLELMGCGVTRRDVIERVDRFARSLGLVTAVVQGESKGFIINRIWRAVKRESLRVVDEGHADPEDVDRLWMLFFGTPIGPFGVMDMVGLDVVADIETSYQRVATDPADQPSKVLHQRLAAGALGEKTGQGFYRHPDPEYLDFFDSPAPNPERDAD
ncbi:MAG: 3-hydroxyacyl-CoA dehydrogenase family protein [Chloroflexia bacterium]|nr:3-hydroxyacyl-CoA dehydrogenase family protein [Chloroflexia bacterium]